MTRDDASAAARSCAAADSTATSCTAAASRRAAVAEASASSARFVAASICSVADLCACVSSDWAFSAFSCVHSTHSSVHIASVITAGAVQTPSSHALAFCKHVWHSSTRVAFA